MLKDLYYYIKNYKEAKTVSFLKYHKLCKIARNLI